ncbi:MAG TPA: hypothetical protein DG577_10820 [Firmicutes bacterium]|jgi:hypothetical protein|nr:hypothetical protein [Bacillota bacterium]
MTIVIGAGAAGLLAAVAAVRRGRQVFVYDKMDRPGIKLGLAGGGRCNLSNSGDLLLGLHNCQFLRPALVSLDNAALQNLLAKIGVATTVDQWGRVFPQAMTGHEFAAYLHSWLRKQGTSFYFGSPLTNIRTKDGKLEAIEINGKAVACTRAILACGGKAWPQTGSDGAALAVLERAGHEIVHLLPALAPLKTRESWPTQMKGISLKDVVVTVTANGRKLDEARGDLLFTHFGLSGPAVLDVSHAAARARSQQLQTFIVIDLLPAMSKEEIRSALEKQGQKTVGNGLSALLPAQLGKALGNDKYIKGLAPSTLNQLAGGLKAVRLEIIDVLGNNHAMVSQGGVNLRQVNPRTMESKLISGLYIAGEMLDYHGKTGGFNLHAAFATGWLAGENA